MEVAVVGVVGVEIGDVAGVVDVVVDAEVVVAGVVVRMGDVDGDSATLPDCKRVGIKPMAKMVARHGRSHEIMRDRSAKRDEMS